MAKLVLGTHRALCPQRSRQTGSQRCTQRLAATPPAVGARRWRPAPSTQGPGVPGRPNARALATSTSTSDFAEVAAVFGRLLDAAGVEAKGVELGEGDYGRGLFASRSLGPGDVILSVPLSSCFVVGRDYGMSLPGTTFEQLQAGELSGWPMLAECTAGENGSIFAGLDWDLRLALAIADLRENSTLRETGSANGDGPEAAKGGLWSSMMTGMGQKKRRASDAGEWLPLYCSLLPTDDPFPICFSLEELQALQDSGLTAEVSAEQRLLEQLADVPSMSNIPGVSKEALAWSLAMVRSRSFDATQDTFVMAPVLDMVNHAWQGPNAEVQLRLETSSDPDEAVLQLKGDVCLCAIQPLAKGDEVTFSYGCNYAPSDQLLRRYAMLRPEPNPYDSLPLLEMVQHIQSFISPSPESEQFEASDSQDSDASSFPPLGDSELVDLELLEKALEEAVTNEGQRWLQVMTTDNALRAVLSSMEPLAKVSSSTPTSDAEASIDESVEYTLQTLTEYVLRKIAAFSHQSVPEFESNSQRGEAISRYRTSRLELWSKALWVLETYLASSIE